MNDKNKCVMCAWQQASPHFVSSVALFPDTPEPYSWTITERPALESVVPPACPLLGHRESRDLEEGMGGLTIRQVQASRDPREAVSNLC